MKIYQVLFTFIIIVFSSENSISQEVDSIYGLNPILYNGQIYTYYVPKSVLGDQYLSYKDFDSGSISINHNDFNNVLLNYDVYNQEILVSLNLNQRSLIIKLFKNRINSFVMGDDYFELIKDDQSDYVIYQVIGDGYYKVLYHWQKYLKLSNDTNPARYVFTKPFKKMYLMFDNQMFKYKNNRTFLSVIEESKKQQIKKYLKKHKIKVNTASDKDLIKLLEFSNTL